jgi:eukaryotic-like serine/threonine-protein kinase
LTGKRPFEAETMMGTLQQVLQVTPINPSQLSQHISPALDRIIGQALAKRPEGSRYFCESLFWASQPKQAAKT